MYSVQALLDYAMQDMIKRYLAIAQTDIDSDHEKESPVKVWKRRWCINQKVGAISLSE